jgi:hypothetical protein
LPTNLKYSISAKGIRITEAEFLTLRLLKPYNLEEEQEVPPVNTSQYYWVRYDNISEIYDYVREYYHNLPKGQSPRVVKITFPTAVSALPTEDQYNAGGQYHTEICICEIRIYSFSPYQGETYYVAETKNYTTWLEPRSR